MNDSSCPRPILPALQRPGIRGYIVIVLLSLSLIVEPSYGNSDDAMSRALISQADALQLASHPTWINLLHYKKSSNRFRSEVISPDFFLSPNGATDPADELQATLRAMLDQAGDIADNHAQCRFIARYRWLRQTLDWSQITVPEINCSQFLNWSRHGNISSISLVFATGYLGNPASFYGHILLKFNSDRNHPGTDLLDQSINYGAIVPDNEMAPVYIFKGIFGGYQAGFSSNQFYFHNHNYGENELRDMWEYQLALSKYEVDLLVAHSWELLGNRFVYYFANQNCSYQMAELLQLVIDQPLLPPLPWSQPGSLFDRLVEIERNKKPVVAKIKRIASRQNRFYESFYALDEELKKITSQLADNDLVFADLQFQQLNSEQQINILNTLLEYVEFRIVSEDDDTQFKSRKKAILTERLRLPAETRAQPSQRDYVAPPHEGPRPNMIRTGLLHNSELGNGISFQLRPAYFDFLSLDAGRLANSHLSMIDLTAVVTESHLWLRKLDFIHVTSLNVSQTGLPGDGGLAWKVRSGVDSIHLGCDDCRMFHVTGGLGKAFSFSPQTVTDVMLEVRAQTSYESYGNYAAIAGIGLITSPVVGWKTHIYAGQEQYLDGSRSHTPLVTFENRFGSDRDWDVRLSYQDHEESEVTLALSWYW